MPKPLQVCTLQDEEVLSLIDGFIYSLLSFKASYINLHVHYVPEMANYSIKGVCRGLGHRSQTII